MPDLALFHSVALWLLIALFIALLVSVLLLFIRRRRKEHPYSPDDTVMQTTLFMPDELDNQHLHDLLSLSTEWLWSTDEHHHYQTISDGLLTHAGIPPAALIGHSPWRAPWRALTPAAWHVYHAQVKARQPVKIIVKTPSRSDETRFRFFELKGFPVKNDEQFIGYYGVACDISERMDLFYALEESQTLYRELINSVSEVVFRTDDEGRLTQLNHAWSQLTSGSPQYALERPLLSFIHPDDQHTFNIQMSAVISGEQDEFSDEFRLLTPDGKVRWIEATATRLPLPRAHARRTGENASGEAAGLIGTLNDITPRKISEMTLRNITQELEMRVRQRTAELEASNRELEAFSYSVSHDLRAPLRAIDGFARILEEDIGDQLTPDAATHLERIRAASQRMSDLIDSLIELARVTRQALRKEYVNLSEIAVQIIDELKAEDPAKQVDVKVTSDLMASCDRTLMRVVLENLLGNAWKFSAGRSPAQISFTADHDGAQRVFCVSDNGAGFDMAFADKLFSPFQRLHDKAHFSGSGIGLANVKKIIERHGGKVWAESSPEHGAQFFFTLGV